MFLCRHAIAITPAEPLVLCRSSRICPGLAWHQRRRPSRPMCPVGFRIIVFEACSAFTARYGLSACWIAERSIVVRGSGQFRCLHCRSDCYRLERPLAGWVYLPLKHHAFHGAHSGHD